MRLMGFLLKLAIAVCIVVWLANRPGAARIVWGGYVIETSAAFFALLLFFVVFLLSWLSRLWRFFRDGPRFWRLRQKLKKTQKGQKQLTQGIVALAAGDAAEAGRLAVSARRLLGVTPMTRFLQAQAAQLAGDHDVAKEIFLTLAAEPDSAVLGYRGLIRMALKEGNWEEAERQVEKLRRLKPETPWLSLIRFEMAARRQHWRDASAALAQASAAHLLDAAHAKKHQAALLLAVSDDEARQGKNEQALHTASQAVRYAPGWLPAVIALAQKQLAADRSRAARKTIEKAWATMPHPQLASLYCTSVEAKDLLAVYKKIERLTQETLANPISRIALAEAALAADLWGEARRHLLALVTRKEATQKVYRLLAKLERRESGDEQMALQWLTKAAEAPPDAVWLCSFCGGGHEEWQGTCPHCKAFNSLSWQTPGVSRCESQEGLIAYDSDF